MIRRLKKIPLFLFLLPLFFCLHGSVEYFDHLTAIEVIKLWLIISAAVALLFFIIRYFTKSSVFAALVTFYIGLWNLFFGALHDGLKSSKYLLWLSSYTILLPLLLISTVAWTFVLGRKKNLQNKLLYYFNLLLLIYCVYDISLLLIKSFATGKKTTETRIGFNYPAVTKKPDVYYLLFDAYPGYKSLKDSFNFKNDSLYSFFQHNNFEVLPAFTNYNFTYHSMSSVFNMRYLHIQNPDSITQSDYLQQMKEIKNAQVFSIFDSMGYSIKNLSIFDIGEQERVSNNELVPSHLQLLTHKILYRKFLKEAGWIFTTGKYEIPFIKKFFLRKDDLNMRIERELYDNLQNTTDEPEFTYAHLFLPHQPFYFDSSGNYLPAEITHSSSSVYNKDYYLGYIKYTNTKIISIVNAIIKNNSNAVIIIMSDHGYRFYRDNEPYHFDNICAVRYGNTVCLNKPARLGSVNFFRYIFNCIYNQNLPYLKDTSIFLKEYAPVR